MFDPSVTFEDLAWIKEQWPGKLVVKGVQNVDDAKTLADMGVDGILLSNHGGRQLDRAPIPFHLLPEVVREVGKDTEVHLDTGIMSGADIVAAIASVHDSPLSVAPTSTGSWRAGGKASSERSTSSLRRSFAPCGSSGQAHWMN